MQTQIYLFFDGRTDEALAFYKKTLGIEVEMLMRFKDAPGDPNAPADPNCQPPANMNAVMHSCFKLGDQRVMASDGHVGGKPEFKGFALSLAVKSEGGSRQAVRRAQRRRAGDAAVDQDVLLAEIRYAGRQVRCELDGAGRAVTREARRCRTCCW